MTNERGLHMRDVYPIKYYSDEDFVERKIEINEEDLEKIIEDYLIRNAKFDFDEIEIVNNCPMNIWLYAKCRTFLESLQLKLKKSVPC